MLRLKGKGLPSVQNYGVGDQIVHINVWTPKKLSREEKELIEKFRDSENFKPAPNVRDKNFFEKVREMFGR